eukprot:TRINITY_DN76509_c0_g1_i1.p1 TRINITY_DN76509_c0_g1~~TRINITY_DN76509_c0_g1_i1.p1  ORF type:complete len:285 (-),score=34.48 TRINITY_DN76509_c0_g1_i1:31-771(-)
MEARQSVQIVAGKGVEGDRYCTARGTYTTIKEPGRQLTLISADAVETQVMSSGLEPFPIGDLRRNIILRGIDKDGLNNLTGYEVMVGDSCKLFVHRLCVPCKYIEAKNKRTGLMEKLWQVSGVNCEVLVGGQVSVGDSVRQVPGSYCPQRIDVGMKPDAFFVQPSKRTPEQHKELSMIKDQAALLFEKDGPGAARLELAYRSVGLYFFPRGILEAYQQKRMLRSGLFLTTAALGIVIVAIALARSK